MDKLKALKNARFPPAMFCAPFNFGKKKQPPGHHHHEHHEHRHHHHLQDPDAGLPQTESVDTAQAPFEVQSEELASTSSPGGTSSYHSAEESTTYPEEFPAPAPEASRLLSPAPTPRKPSTAVNIPPAEEPDVLAVEITGLVVYKPKPNTCCRKTSAVEKHILDHIDISVKKGTIYTIIGASGSGKSTVLSCILGFTKPCKGTVKVFGEPAGTKGIGIPGCRVSFMPQELALYSELGITETAAYYAALYGLTMNDIQHRFLFLFDLLELPCANTKVKKLSRSQKRRLCLLVAFIHSPELVLLDEPFNGLDALHKNYVWKLFQEVVAEDGVTIILTTESIEDGAPANLMSLMHHGRVLTEKDPENLLADYGKKSLQDVLLRLCQKECGVKCPGKNSADPTKHTCKTDFNFGNSYKNAANVLPPESSPTARMLKVKADHTARFISAKRIYALTVKDMLVMVRHWILLLSGLFIPALMMGIVCLTLGYDLKSVKLGVVNKENSLSDCLTYPKPNYSGMKCVDDEPVMIAKADFSCQIMAELSRSKIKLVGYDSVEKATEELENGKILGYLSFPEKFSDNMWERMKSGFDARQYILEQSSIDMRFDMSNKHVYNAAFNHIREGFYSFIVGLLEGCMKNPKIAQQPLTVGAPVYGNKDTSIMEFIAPGTLMGIIFFFPMLFSAFSLLQEKKHQKFEKALSVGVKHWEILLSRINTDLTIHGIHAGSLILVMCVIFGIEVKGSFLWVTLLIAAVGFCGMSLGYLLAVFCYTKFQAFLWSCVIALPMTVFSGMIWPLGSTHQCCRYFGYILPNTLSINALRSVITRGWGITRCEVWLGLVIPITWIVLLWVFIGVFHGYLEHRKRRC